MAQYPIDNNEDLFDAVNYLLSGPTSRGQNFEGVSAVGLPTLIIDDMLSPEAQTYFTGLQAPATVNRYKEFLLPADFYYPIWSTLPGGLTVTNIVPTAPTSDKITITITPGLVPEETQSPLCVGQTIVLSGVTPAGFNGTYVVVDCGETDSAPLPNTAVLQAAASQTWPAYVSGGIAEINPNSYSITPLQFDLGLRAEVTVTGPTDRVFVSAQVSLDVYTYTLFDAVASYQPLIYFNINRYKAIKPSSLPNTIGPIVAGSNFIYNGYEWTGDGGLISVPYAIDWDLLGTQVYTNQVGLKVFNNIIDQPGIGQYLYALQIESPNYRDPAPDTGCVLVVGARTYDLRSFTAQVIKQ